MEPPTASNPPAPFHGEARPPRFTGRMFLGLVVIGVGVLFLLDAVGVPGIHDIWREFWRYWPVLFVFIGLMKFANAYSLRDRVAGFIWIVLGALLIANNLDWIDFNVWHVFWPALIILFGVSLVTRSFGAHVLHGAHAEPSQRFSAFAIWSGVTRKLSTPEFRGGDASAIMGGCEIDLRQCGLGAGPATIDLFALMGGIELYVPGDWTVQNDGLAIMGAIEDERKETAGDPTKVLILRGAAIMGGVEIKN